MSSIVCLFTSRNHTDFFCPAFMIISDSLTPEGERRRRKRTNRKRYRKKLEEQKIMGDVDSQDDDLDLSSKLSDSTTGESPSTTPSSAFRAIAAAFVHGNSSSSFNSSSEDEIVELDPQVFEATGELLLKRRFDRNAPLDISNSLPDPKHTEFLFCEPTNAPPTLECLSCGSRRNSCRCISGIGAWASVKPLVSSLLGWMDW